MSLLGLDEEMEEKEENVETIEEVKKKRKPFAIWTVGGRDYKLKLKTDIVCKIEDKYRVNLLSLVTDTGIPPLSVMLTLIHGAMMPWEHGVKIKDVQKLFDAYVGEGGSQSKLLIDVVMPIMTVSGFFTESQTEELLENLEEAEAQF